MRFFVPFIRATSFGHFLSKQQGNLRKTSIKSSINGRPEAQVTKRGFVSINPLPHFKKYKDAYAGAHSAIKALGALLALGGAGGGLFLWKNWSDIIEYYYANFKQYGLKKVQLMSARTETEQCEFYGSAKKELVLMTDRGGKRLGDLNNLNVFDMLTKKGTSVKIILATPETLSITYPNIGYEDEHPATHARSFINKIKKYNEKTNTEGKHIELRLAKTMPVFCAELVDVGLEYTKEKYEDRRVQLQTRTSHPDISNRICFDFEFKGDISKVEESIVKVVKEYWDEAIPYDDYLSGLESPSSSSRP